MLAAMAIGPVDGTLAVRWGAPPHHGRRLDDVVDFFNYVLCRRLPGRGRLPDPAPGRRCRCWRAPTASPRERPRRMTASSSDSHLLERDGIFAWLLESRRHRTAFVALFSVRSSVPSSTSASYLRVLKRTTAVLTASRRPSWSTRSSIGRARQLCCPDRPRLRVYYFALSFWLGGLHRQAR
jgi:hypothetical protein